MEPRVGYLRYVVVVQPHPVNVINVQLIVIVILVRVVLILQVRHAVMERLVLLLKYVVVGRLLQGHATIVLRLRLTRMITPVLIVGILFLLIQILVHMVMMIRQMRHVVAVEMFIYKHVMIALVYVA